STHPSTNGCAAVSGPGSMSTGSRPITSCAAAWSPSWKLSVAVANSGELQLELIQPRNDASSAFTEFLDAGHEGAQRVAYWTEDFQRLYDNALSLGYTVTQEGSIGGEHGRFAYLDT